MILFLKAPVSWNSQCSGEVFPDPLATLGTLDSYQGIQFPPCTIKSVEGVWFNHLQGTLLLLSSLSYPKGNGVQPISLSRPSFPFP